jgi:hypothetical protein
MIDFQSFRASLASVSIIPLRESTKALKGRSKGGCRRPFSLATAVRCLSTSLAVFWAGESSSVVAKGNVVGLGILGGEGDDGDVDVFAWESTRSRSDDPDVVSALCAGDKRF